MPTPSRASAPVAPASPTSSPAPPPAGAAGSRGALGKLIHENTQFLSSVVIGGAGLIATSLYQCNNSKLAQRQADWQRRMEIEKSDNAWRIERAKILAQNLQTLTARGGDTVEQRYGVLLSLTRGKILERDLAVSYALELGKDSPEDMRSVLSNIEDKDQAYYRRLVDAYVPTCTQRYGVAATNIRVCDRDNLAGFSRGLAESLADDLATQPELASSPPAALLRDERYVHTKLLPLVGIFGEFIGDTYERRQWTILERFFDASKGARLVGTLSLLAQTIDQTNPAEQAAIRARFDEGQRWLRGYLTSPSCDGECRSRVVAILLSQLGQSPDHFPWLLSSLLDGPHGDVAPVIGRLHGRLSLCQIDARQFPVLRDRVLVPALLGQLARAQPEPQRVNDLLGLLGLLPVPPTGSPDWSRVESELTRVTKGQEPKAFLTRYAADARRRSATSQQVQAGPPGPERGRQTKAARADFCSLVSQALPQDTEEEE